MNVCILFHIIDKEIKLRSRILAGVVFSRHIYTFSSIPRIDGKFNVNAVGEVSTCFKCVL